MTPQIWPFEVGGDRFNMMSLRLMFPPWLLKANQECVVQQKHNIVFAAREDQPLLRIVIPTESGLSKDMLRIIAGEIDSRSNPKPQPAVEWGRLVFEKTEVGLVVENMRVSATFVPLGLWDQHFPYLDPKNPVTVLPLCIDPTDLRALEFQFRMGVEFQHPLPNLFS